MTPARRQGSRPMLWISVAVGLALILTGLLMFPQLRKQQSDLVLPELKPYYQELADGNALGSPDAPLTVMEFSDFQCPHCQRWFRETEAAFIEEFVIPGKVRFVYRTMGDFLGPESLNAGMALYCAEEQGAFWPYHAILFLNPPARPNSGAYAPERLVSMAEALGLDVQAFEACLKEERYRDRAMQDQQDGVRFGVRGTPAFVFQTQDGRSFLLEGAHPITSFRQAVAQLLSSSE